MNAGTRLWVAVLALVVLALGPVGAAWAQVKVTSAEPASTTQGTSGLDVTISGSGFDASAAVRFLVTGTENPGGIAVTRVVVVNPKKLIATIDAADDAAIAAFDIEVSLSSGRKGKGTTLFTVAAKNVDPCAGVTNFPSFVYGYPYVRDGSEIRLSDATGTCTRTIAQAKGDYTRQILIAMGANQWRVVWRDGWHTNTSLTPGVTVDDFTVDFANGAPVVTLTRSVFIAGPIWAFDAMPGGGFAYIEQPEAGPGVIRTVDSELNLLLVLEPGVGLEDLAVDPSTGGVHFLTSPSSGQELHFAGGGTLALPGALSISAGSSGDRSYVAVQRAFSGHSGCDPLTYRTELYDAVNPAVDSVTKISLIEPSWTKDGRLLGRRSGTSGNGKRCQGTYFEGMLNVDPFSGDSIVLGDGWRPDAP